MNAQIKTMVDPNMTIKELGNSTLTSRGAHMEQEVGLLWATRDFPMDSLA